MNIIQKIKDLRPKKTNESPKEINPIIDFLQSVVLALFICIVVYVFIATPNQIEGDSMKPSLHNNEIILTSKLHQWLGYSSFFKSIGLDYQRGDIIVFHKPDFTKDYIKRIIGLPGEKISLKQGRIYINGKEMDEKYLAENYTIPGTFLKDDGVEHLIPQDSYFVMGDNRGDSHDSRYADVQFVDRSWMKGKVVLRYWPPITLIGEGESKFL